MSVAIKLTKRDCTPVGNVFEAQSRFGAISFFFVADWVGEKKIDNIMYPRFKEINKKNTTVALH